jgi:F420-dependent oxidoreductase-like protein
MSFDVSFGVHTGLQGTTADEMIGLWQQIEAFGYDWISIWDHFYGASLNDDPDCLEAVAMHSALACSTQHVRCGSLVYSVGYRNPAVLANAITAIDHLSHGRAEIGIGAGWSEIEYRAYGIPFPNVGTRMDQLEEGIQCLRGLLHDETTDFEGKWFTLADARNAPAPIQPTLPIWVGGLGEKRTLPIAARYADGWNGAAISPETFVHKSAVLDRQCEAAGRDPSDIRRAVNLPLVWGDEDFKSYGGLAEVVRPGAIFGSHEQVRDRIGQYVDAGVQQINFSVRAPYTRTADDLERLANVLGLTAQDT